MRERRIGSAVEWVVLLAATAAAWLSAPDKANLAGDLIIAMLSFAIGIQNAMVRVHGVPDLATNVMTVTFTGIVAGIRTPCGNNHDWRRRGLSDRPVHDERRGWRGTDTVRHRLAVGADEHRVEFGNDSAAFRRSSVEIARSAVRDRSRLDRLAGDAANLKPVAADPGSRLGRGAQPSASSHTSEEHPN